MSFNKRFNAERYMLKSFRKKNCFDKWRLVTKAISSSTEEECLFFFDFLVLNPSVSPDSVVIGRKNPTVADESYIQYALTGSEIEKKYIKLDSEIPSYAMVSVCKLGNLNKHVNNYFKCNSLNIGKDSFIITFGKDSETECTFADDYSVGSVFVNNKMLVDKPEYLSNTGYFKWNLKFEKLEEPKNGYLSGLNNWNIVSGKVNCEGSIDCDGETFIVESRNSFAYIDKDWGRVYQNPLYHLSSNNFISQITGQRLTNSYFAVQGVYNDSLSVLLHLEGEDYYYTAKRNNKNELKFDVSESKSDEDSALLHWSISLFYKKSVLDIDIFCPTNKLHLRDYECTYGESDLMEVLSGNGYGEIKFYHQNKKTLELIEHIRVVSCLCEYGNIQGLESEE